MSIESEPSVAIVGAGWMGETHLRCYWKQGVRVIGLVDPDTEKAKSLGKCYGVDAVYSTLQDLLAQHSPTGVSITSPENHHVDDAVLALRNRIGVLIEKPLASNLSDGRRIVEAAKASGAILVPAHVLRFSAPYRALREQVAGGDIGDVVAVAARRDRSKAIGAQYRQSHVAHLIMVHDLDQIIWITGSRFQRIRAFEHRSPETSQADLVLVQGKMTSGVLVTLSSGTLLPRGVIGGVSDRFEVYGSSGVAHVDLSHPSVVVHGERDEAPDWILDPSDANGAFGAEIKHFVERLVTGQPSDIVGPEDAIAGLVALDAIMQSVENDGCDVWIE